MNILGVGAAELVAVLLIMLVFAGPKRMIHWSYVLGQHVAKFRKIWSETVDLVQKEFDEAGVDIKLPKEPPTRKSVNQQRRRSHETHDPAGARFARRGQERPRYGQRSQRFTQQQETCRPAKPEARRLLHRSSGPQPPSQRAIRQARPARRWAPGAARPCLRTKGIGVDLGAWSKAARGERD